MKSAGQRGFTLLELLVAVALTSIVVLGLMAVYWKMATTYSYISKSRESAMQIRALAGILGDDLLTLSKEFSFIGTTGESSGHTAYMESSFSAGVDLDRGAVRLLEFVSGVTVERQDAEPILTRVMVIYSVTRVDDEELWTLMRRERPHPSIDGDWRNLPIPVLQHVEKLKFYYETSSDTVQDFWSASPGRTLPAFVRLDFILRHGDKRSEYSLRFPVARRL